jgi:hypothetical protein
MKTKKQTIDLFEQMGIEFNVNESLQVIEVKYKKEESYKSKRFVAYNCTNHNDSSRPWKVMLKGGKQHLKWCKTIEEAISIINNLES